MPPPRSLPTFFFSYARLDEEQSPPPTMRRFFDDLQNALEAVTQGLPARTRLGTYDRRIAHGRDWDDELSSGLKTNKALVVVATPRYFERENCGKEIAVFARRMHPAVQVIDGNLRHASNILHIRWLDDAAYANNGVADAQVHPLLRKVTWTPPDVPPNSSADAARRRADAVRRYRDLGMQKCVKPKRDYYDELVTAFRESIREMPDLPEASFPVAWNNIKSAYEQGWTNEWQAATAAPEPAAGPPPNPPEPAGPGDVVVFYLTPRFLFLDIRTVSFADALVNEPDWRQSPASAGAESFLAFLQAVQQAALAERLNDFHCACTPQIPTEPDRLIGQLAALTRRNVLVAVAVDPVLWLGGDRANASARTVLDRIFGSEQWGGPVLLPMLNEADRALGIRELVAARLVPRAVIPLVGSADAMVGVLRTVLIRERGRIMSIGAPSVTAPDERPPLLRGPGGSQR